MQNDLGSNVFIGGSTDYQWTHIYLVILWRTCNFGHLEKKKKMTAKISQCVLQKMAPSSGDPLASVWILAGFLKSSWRGSKEKVFVEHGPCAKIRSYFTYISHWNSGSAACWCSSFTDEKTEARSSQVICILVDSICRTVWFQACASGSGLLLLPDRLV